MPEDETNSVVEKLTFEDGDGRTYFGCRTTSLDGSYLIPFYEELAAMYVLFPLDFLLEGLRNLTVANMGIMCI
tara:strand:- start:429 stop:647 length:219 start_codon:yes stop_codon:yes gene_type:complete